MKLECLLFLLLHSNTRVRDLLLQLDEGAMTSVINNSADQSVSKISQKRPHTEML